MSRLQDGNEELSIFNCDRRACVCVAMEGVEIHVLRLVVLEGELWESVLRSSH